jgi:hypothetical protein
MYEDKVIINNIRWYWHILRANKMRIMEVLKMPKRKA